jgi:hypothetical protein
MPRGEDVPLSTLAENNVNSGDHRWLLGVLGDLIVLLTNCFVAVFTKALKFPSHNFF